METTPLADATCLSVADDLDVLRRSLPVEGDLTPHLARLLAACGGTLRGYVSTRGPGGGRPASATAEESS